MCTNGTPVFSLLEDNALNRLEQGSMKYSFHYGMRPHGQKYKNLCIEMSRSKAPG